MSSRSSDENPYWLGPFENYNTFCPYLVGSYDRVADEVARYISLGFTTFILDIPPSEEEIEHTAVVFDRAQDARVAVTALLQEYVARQAEARPDDVALVMGDERLTYGELEAASNRLARLLREVGCARGDRVCLFVPKTPAAIVAELATLKADCAYVPIDTASPAPRVELIVESAEPSLILVAAPAAKLLDERRSTTPRRSRSARSTTSRCAGERFPSAFSAADHGRPVGRAAGLA